MMMTFTTKLEAFEGPLDLLLHLVKINEVDISDIPMATITDQYLEYLDLLRALDINVAGEFLVMASTLIHLKSKMLLPKQEQDLEEIEDLKEEILRPLKEYLQLKEAASELASRDILYRDVFRRGGELDGKEGFEEDIDTVKVNLYELMEAFRDVIKRRYPGIVIKFRAQTWSIKQKMAEIMNRLKGKRNLRFRDLFTGDWPLSELIATFLALLELVKMGSISIFQGKEGSDIKLEASNRQA
jgi:segregation and condensation protein A